MPLPDESSRGSIANLINRFENQTKRASSQQGHHPISSRSSSVVSHTSSVGDASTIEVKEKKEWPPRNLGGQGTQLPGDKPGFVMPSYLRPSVNALASTVSGSLSRTSSNGSGGLPGGSVAKDASKSDTVDTPKAATPPTDGSGPSVQQPLPISQSISDSSPKSDSSSSQGVKPAIPPVDTTKAAQKSVEEAASENGDVEPDTPKPGVRRKASTLTVTAASGTIPAAPSTKSAAIGKTPTTAKPPGTAKPAVKPPTKPAATTTTPKTPAKAAPSSFKGSASATAASRPLKTITPKGSLQSLKPQHTGGSVTSTASTQRKPASKPTPATPSRAKTPSKAPASASTVSRAKSPARARTPAKPTPTTGLYAPTAASLAKSRNAPPLPATTPVKKVMSSEVADRLSKPTQASLSKARAPVGGTPPKQTGAPRPSFGGGPGTPVKKAASTMGSTPSKPSTSTPLRKAASAASSPKKGDVVTAGAAAGIAVAAAAAATSGVASESEVVEAAQSEPETIQEPEPETAVEEEEHAQEEEEVQAEPQHDEEVTPETEPAPEANGTKVGSEIEDMVNLLEFTPIAKIKEAMEAEENANGKAVVSAEEVQAEIPDENSE